MTEPGDLSVHGLAVTFAQRRGAPVAAARADALCLRAGSMLGLAGPSGSGKTTLLLALAGLLRPAAGTVRWGATDLAALSEGARDQWRRTHLGFVFQDFHLVPELSARDNVRLPSWFGSGAPARSRGEADALLARMGIPDPASRTGLLSRGEQQRVAIARAVLGRPAVVLADEPTASLDAGTAALVADLLVAAIRGAAATLVLASHDPAILARMQSVRRMEKGVLLP